MMNGVRSLILGLAAVMLLSFSAQAKTYEVKSGVAKTVDGIYIYSQSDCRIWAPSSYSIYKKPQHGKASLQIRQVTLPKGTRCAGKKGKIMVIVYQSKRGYKGPDNFTINFTYQQFTSDTGTQNGRRIKVNVK